MVGPLEIKHNTPEGPQQRKAGQNKNRHPNQHGQPQRGVGDELERERERDDDNADDENNENGGAVSGIFDVKALAAALAMTREFEEAIKQ